MSDVQRNINEGTLSYSVGLQLPRRERHGRERMELGSLPVNGETSKGRSKNISRPNLERTGNPKTNNKLRKSNGSDGRNLSCVANGGSRCSTNDSWYPNSNIQREPREERIIRLHNRLAKQHASDEYSGKQSPGLCSHVNISHSCDSSPVFFNDCYNTRNVSPSGINVVESSRCSSYMPVWNKTSYQSDHFSQKSPTPKKDNSFHDAHRRHGWNPDSGRSGIRTSKRSNYEAKNVPSTAELTYRCRNHTSYHNVENRRPLMDHSCYHRNISKYPSHLSGDQHFPRPHAVDIRQHKPSSSKHEVVKTVSQNKPHFHSHYPPNHGPRTPLYVHDEDLNFHPSRSNEPKKRHRNAYNVILESRQHNNSCARLRTPSEFHNSGEGFRSSSLEDILDNYGNSSAESSQHIDMSSDLAQKVYTACMLNEASPHRPGRIPVNQVAFTSQKNIGSYSQNFRLPNYDLPRAEKLSLLTHLPLRKGSETTDDEDNHIYDQPFTPQPRLLSPPLESRQRSYSSTAAPHPSQLNIPANNVCNFSPSESTKNMLLINSSRLSMSDPDIVRHFNESSRCNCVECSPYPPLVYGPVQPKHTSSSSQCTPVLSTDFDCGSDSDALDEGSYFSDVSYQDLRFHPARLVYRDKKILQTSNLSERYENKLRQKSFSSSDNSSSAVNVSSQGRKVSAGGSKSKSLKASLSNSLQNLSVRLGLRSPTKDIDFQCNSARQGHAVSPVKKLSAPFFGYENLSRSRPKEDTLIQAHWKTNDVADNLRPPPSRLNLSRQRSVSIDSSQPAKGKRNFSKSIIYDQPFQTPSSNQPNMIVLPASYKSAYRQRQERLEIVTKRSYEKKNDPHPHNIPALPEVSPSNAKVNSFDNSGHIFLADNVSSRICSPSEANRLQHSDSDLYSINNIGIPVAHNRNHSPRAVSQTSMVSVQAVKNSASNVINRKESQLREHADNMRNAYKRVYGVGNGKANHTSQPKKIFSNYVDKTRATPTQQSHDRTRTKFNFDDDKLADKQNINCNDSSILEEKMNSPVYANLLVSRKNGGQSLSIPFPAISSQKSKTGTRDENISNLMLGYSYNDRKLDSDSNITSKDWKTPDDSISKHKRRPNISVSPYDNLKLSGRGPNSLEQACNLHIYENVHGLDKTKDDTFTVLTKKAPHTRKVSLPSSTAPSNAANMQENILSNVCDGSCTNNIHNFSCQMSTSLIVNCASDPNLSEFDECDASDVALFEKRETFLFEESGTDCRDSFASVALPLLPSDYQSGESSDAVKEGNSTPVKLIYSQQEKRQQEFQQHKVPRDKISKGSRVGGSTFYISRSSESNSEATVHHASENEIHAYNDRPNIKRTRKPGGYLSPKILRKCYSPSSSSVTDGSKTRTRETSFSSSEYLSGSNCDVPRVRNSLPDILSSVRPNTYGPLSSFDDKTKRDSYVHKQVHLRESLARDVHDGQPRSVSNDIGRTVSTSLTELTPSPLQDQNKSGKKTLFSRLMKKIQSPIKISESSRTPPKSVERNDRPRRFKSVEDLDSSPVLQQSASKSRTLPTAKGIYSKSNSSNHIESRSKTHRDERSHQKTWKSAQTKLRKRAKNVDRYGSLDSSALIGEDTNPKAVDAVSRSLPTTLKSRKANRRAKLRRRSSKRPLQVKGVVRGKNGRRKLGFWLPLVSVPASSYHLIV